MNAFSTLDNFRIIKTLGFGAYAKVKVGQNLQTGETFALKILTSSQPSEATMVGLRREVDILRALNNPSIIKMFDLRMGTYYSRTKDAQRQVIYAVMELATGGEIFEALFQAQGFSENLSRFFFKQLVESMRFLHGLNVVHRDLKPENLLFDSQFNLKIADFGFATLSSPQKLNKTILGTAMYMAPELIDGQPYDPRKVDVFAAGVVLFVMYSGYPPFNKASCSDAYYKAIRTANDRFWAFHSSRNKKRVYSPAFRDLVNRMLDINPDNRPTFTEIATDFAWFKEQVNKDEALAQMANYVCEIHKARQQAIPSSSFGNNRGEAEGETLEELEKMVLPDIRFEDLTDIKVEVPVPNSAVIQSADRNLLVAMVRKTAEEVGCVPVGDKKDRLVLSHGSQEQCAAVFEVRFSKLADAKFEVQFLLKSGDYFAFQKAKALVQQALNAKTLPLDICGNGQI